jgi:pimeloyl-ACP methyl ester carboxylesterase
MREIQLSDVEGARYVPAEHSGVGALVLAGSSGRVDGRRAEVLAKRGVLAESIRWFGGEGQHEGPWEIPIESFLDRVADLRHDCERVIVVGTSFGAEAALLSGALSDNVDAVVAFAPSDVVWAGVTADGRVTSHWTYEGVPLPFVPFAEDWEPTDEPPAYVDHYR